MRKVGITCMAFLALVPAGAVARGVYDTMAAISFVFPFKACLQALDAAVNGARSPVILVSAEVCASVRPGMPRPPPCANMPSTVNTARHVSLTIPDFPSTRLY